MLSNWKKIKWINEVNIIKVVIILKAMAALNLSTKNSNRGREEADPSIIF